MKGVAPQLVPTGPVSRSLQDVRHVGRRVPVPCGSTQIDLLSRFFIVDIVPGALTPIPVRKMPPCHAACDLFAHPGAITPTAATSTMGAVTRTITVPYVHRPRGGGFRRNFVFQQRSTSRWQHVAFQVDTSGLGELTA